MHPDAKPDTHRAILGAALLKATKAGRTINSTLDQRGARLLGAADPKIGDPFPAIDAQEQPEAFAKALGMTPELLASVLEGGAWLGAEHMDEASAVAGDPSLPAKLTRTRSAEAAVELKAGGLPHSPARRVLLALASHKYIDPTVLARAAAMLERSEDEGRRARVEAREAAAAPKVVSKPKKAEVVPPPSGAPS